MFCSFSFSTFLTQSLALNRCFCFPFKIEKELCSHTGHRSIPSEPVSVQHISFDVSQYVLDAGSFNVTLNYFSFPEMRAIFWARST